jgi:hypothetical protein
VNDTARHRQPRALFIHRIYVYFKRYIFVQCELSVLFTCVVTLHNSCCEVHIAVYINAAMLFFVKNTMPHVKTEQTPWNRIFCTWETLQQMVVIKAYPCVEDGGSIYYSWGVTLLWRS